MFCATTRVGRSGSCTGFATAAECDSASRKPVAASVAASVDHRVAETVLELMATSTRGPANDLAEARQLAAVDEEDDDTQADDPVSAVMGDLSAIRHELGDVDPYAGDDEAEVPGVLPPSFDVFRVKDEVVDRVRTAGGDPTVVKITVLPVIRGKRRTAIKRLHPEGVTYQKLCAALAPGTYDIQGHNEDNVFMGGKRIRVQRRDFDELGDFDDLDDFGLPRGGKRGRSGGGLGDKLVYELAMKGLRGGEAQGRGSEMGEAIGSMAKMMTLNMQAQAMEATARMKQLELEHKHSRSDSSSQLATLKTILELVDKRTPKRSGGAGARVEDFVGMLQMGMHFQKMMQDGKPEESDAEQLRKWVLPIVDSVGPQLIGLAAMFLPKDKAELLTEVLEQHMKTQEARANAQGENRDTYDTTAEEVKE